MAETARSGIPAVPDGIEVLREPDISSLRIPWDARYSRDEITRIASSRPSLCLWNPRTGGYLIGGLWRHRDEIANVIDVVGPAVSVDLLKGFVARSAELGLELAIVAEYAERRRESFYAAGGMEIIEDIVVYELGRLPKGSDPRASVPELTPVRFDASDRDGYDELIELDHRAFPWLWWNTAEEFENYANAPGVTIELFRDEAAQAIGYIGTTLLGTWGHLDRIAVDPELQGRGYGRKLLAYSIQRLREGGARRIALSTQASNTVSRALYESVGFRRSRNFDYRIFGRYLSGTGH